MMKNIIGILLSAFVLASCAGSKNRDSFDNKITEKYWKLVALNSEAIEWQDGQQKEAHIILKEDENRLTGNTGCNTMGGTFEISRGNQIRFSKFFSTRMACMGVEYEQEFLLALESASKFEIKDDTLFLFNDNNDALATLEAVYLK